MKDIAILDSAIWRVAVKTFDITRKISETDFKILLNVAQYSASSFGLEPWKIIVVQNETIRSEIADCSSGAFKQLKSASHFVIFTVTTDLKPSSQYFKHINIDIKQLNKTSHQEFVSKISTFQQEKHDLTDFRKRLDWAGKQAYFALGNMILASAIMGIDSCPIEGFIPFAVEEILKKNGVINPAEEHIVVMAAFGYRSSNLKSNKVRRSLEEIVRFI